MPTGVFFPIISIRCKEECEIFPISIGTLVERELGCVGVTACIRSGNTDRVLPIVKQEFLRKSRTVLEGHPLGGIVVDRNVHTGDPASSVSLPRMTSLSSVTRIGSL